SGETLAKTQARDKIYRETKASALYNQPWGIARTAWGRLTACNLGVSPNHLSTTMKIFYY
ncbi:MAG: hypothetical protein ACYTF1_27135, partial [Planctomycetota bacterium]